MLHGPQPFSPKRNDQRVLLTDFKEIIHQFWIYNIFFVPQQKKHLLWKVHLDKTTLTQDNRERVLKVSPTHFDQAFAGFRDLTHKRLEKEGCCIKNKNFPVPNYTAYSINTFP